MTSLNSDFCSAAGAKRSKRLSHKTTRDCPRVTVRLSEQDYARLQQLADGLSLSVYMRAMALQEALPKRKTASRMSVEDRSALAQVLGLLGQSRIANNLNQLAYQANIGALVLDKDTKAQIDEAYEYVVVMRQTLLKALGKRG
jgi:hypothetical protein